MSDPTKPMNPEKVAAVVDFVRKNPGCTKQQAAAAVAAHPSYGNKFVAAAIEQGLIRATQDLAARGRPYSLTLS